MLTAARYFRKVEESVQFRHGAPMSRPLNLYKSYDVQWYEDIPFQTVNVVKEESGVVSFTTEWPVRELDCESKDFHERFYKM